MTQFNVNKAYVVLAKISEFKLPVKKAYEIYKLAKTLEERYRFAVDEEKKYIEEFNGTINNDGTVSFENAEIYGAFQEKLSELNDMQVDIEITPVVLTEKDLGEQTISPSDIYNLEGFVTFE